MNIDLTQILLAIITLLGTIITGFLLPWLRRKIEAENTKISETGAALIYMAIDTAVKAAEQLYKSDEGEAKKKYVVDVLKEQGFDVDLASVDAAIEAAVLELHRQLA